MKQQIIKKEYAFKCDCCGREETFDTTKPDNWMIFTVVDIDGLRLFERIAIVARYESFNIPGKIEKTYCSKECALMNLTSSIELFLAEVKPKKQTSSKPIQR